MKAIEIVLMTETLEVIYRKTHQFPDWVKAITIENNNEIVYSDFEPQWKGETGFDFNLFCGDFWAVLEKLPFSHVVEPMKSTRNLNEKLKNFGVTPFFVKV